MKFLNDLGKTLEDVAKQVEEKSTELLETGKLNIEIFKQEDAIKRIYRKIGEQISLDYENGARFGEQINLLCNEIQDRKKKVEELKLKITEVRKSGKGSPENNDQSEVNEANPPAEPEMSSFGEAKDNNDIQDNE